MADHSGFLTAWVQHDKKLITYRLMSRERRIHVNEAKEALQAYYESASKGPNPPHATYVLKGALLPSPPKASQGHDSMDVDTQGGTQESTDSELKVNGSQGEGTSEASEALLLVGEEKLEASKARFREITTCHIYSLQAGALKDPALLTSVEHELHTVKKYVQTWEETERGAQLGVLANLNIQDRYDPSKRAAAVQEAGPSRLPANAPPAKPDVFTKFAAKQAVNVKDASGKDQKEAKEPRRSASLDWSKAKASKPADNKTATKSRPGKRKGSPDSESDSEAVKPSATKSKARGKGAAKGKRAISDSEDEGSDAGPLGYASGDERLDDETDAPRAGSGKRADAAQKSKQQREADKKALEAMMDMDDDPDVETSAQTSTSVMGGNAEKEDTEMADAAGAVISTADKSKKRVRKQRKVTRKEKTKNEKGYIVTRDVEGYESYSSDESDASLPKPAPAPAAKSRAASSSTKANPKSNSTGAGAKASPAPAEEPSKRAQSASSAGAGAKGAGVGAGATKAAPGPAAGKKTQPKKGQQSLTSFFGKPK